MKKIRRLTEAQKDLLRSCFESWKFRFKTDPIDKKKIRSLLHSIYRDTPFTLKDVRFTSSPCKRFSSPDKPSRNRSHRDFRWRRRPLRMPPSSLFRLRVLNRLGLTYSDGIYFLKDPMILSKLGCSLEFQRKVTEKSLRDVLPRDKFATDIFNTLNDALIYLAPDNCLISTDTYNLWLYEALMKLLDISCSKMSQIIQLAYSCFDFQLTDNKAVIIDNPLKIKLDEDGNLHADGESAIAFKDGFEVYAHHGTALPNHIGRIKAKDWQPEMLTPYLDTQTRSVLTRQIGWERIISHFGTIRKAAGNNMEILIVKEPKPGSVWERPDDKISLLKVTCPSTGKIHYLRVPPDIRDCERARQWTLHNENRRFNFVKET